MTHITALLADFDHYARQCDAAISAGLYDVAAVYGESYHRCAEALKRLTGIDPRPQLGVDVA